MGTDEIAELIGAPEGMAALAEWDSHWEEVMRLAEGYGFVASAYAGVAVLSTNEEFVRQNGAAEKAAMLKAAGLGVALAEKAGDLR